MKTAIVGWTIFIAVFVSIGYVVPWYYGNQISAEERAVNVDYYTRRMNLVQEVDYIYLQESASNGALRIDSGSL